MTDTEEHKGEEDWLWKKWVSRTKDIVFLIMGTAILIDEGIILRSKGEDVSLASIAAGFTLLGLPFIFSALGKPPNGKNGKS